MWNVGRNITTEKVIYLPSTIRKYETPQRTVKELNIVVNLPHISSKQVFDGRPKESCTDDKHEDHNMTLNDGI